MKVGMGFAASKTLLSAVELGLFTELAQAHLTVDEVVQRLKLHPRGVRDFLDVLVSLNFLKRDDATGKYSNTPETDYYLDKKKMLSYVGGFLEMVNGRGYEYWGHLTEALKTGKPQNELKGQKDNNLFDVLYADPEKLRLYLRGMTGNSSTSALALAHKFNWAGYKTFTDIGTAQGCVPAQLAMKHPHLTGVGFDLPPCEPIFNEFIADLKLSDRIKYVPGDFFKDEMPKGDVIIMGHVLHSWDLEKKKMLLKKAFNATNPGGVTIVYETMIDPSRKQAAALLFSLHMLIQREEGFNFSSEQCKSWMEEAGFTDVKFETLVGNHTMVVGHKPK